MKRLKRSDLARFLEILSEDRTVYAPQCEDGTVLLREWDGGEPADDYINLDVSPKDVLFPQSEALCRFCGGFADTSVETVEPDGPAAAFGIRPCDIAGLERIERVFTGGDFTDANYAARRENTALIGVACSEAGPNCFCGAVGVSPTLPGGSDVFCYPEESALYLQPRTDLGEELLEAADDVLEDVSADEADQVVSAAEAMEAPRGGADPVEALPQGAFESDAFWADLSEGCLSCGVCAYVCPTCHCFSIFDVQRGFSGVRMRGWDSCQFEEFLLMAGDHNPRPTEQERVRQRFMHKLSYYPEEHDELMCTGCGRCVQSCPVGIHMLRVLKDTEEVL